MDLKRSPRPQNISHSASLSPRTQPRVVSSSVPVTSPLAEILHLSGSLQSVDALIEDALLEDEGGDVDAQLICGSLIGGKLAFQSFDAYGDDEEERRGGTFEGWVEEGEDEEEEREEEEYRRSKGGWAEDAFVDDGHDDEVESVKEAVERPENSNEVSKGKEVAKPRTSSVTSSSETEETTASLSFYDDDPVDPPVDGSKPLHIATHCLNSLATSTAGGSTNATTTAVEGATDGATPTTAEVASGRRISAPPSELKTREASLLKKPLPASRLPVPLSFDLMEARIFREGPAHRRFVLYTIVVKSASASKASMGGGGAGSRAITLEKRFSDFDRLHRSLRRGVPSSASAVSIPPKRLFKNFDAKTIAERSRAFEQYLSQISLDPSVRSAAAFVDFFYGADLVAALDCLQRRCFVNALPALHRCLDVAALVVGGAHRHVFLALCALAAVYHELDEDAAARTHAEAAVEWLRGCDGWTDGGADETTTTTTTTTTATKITPPTIMKGEISPWERRRGRKQPRDDIDDSSSSSSSSSDYHGASVFHLGFTYNILTTPLIELTIRLRWKLGIDKRELEEILDGIQKDPSFVKERKRTLLRAVMCLRPEM